LIVTLPPRTAKDIFLAALDRQPAERGALLDEACAGDAALRRQVEALLRVHDEPDSLLDRPRIPLNLPGDGPSADPDATLDPPMNEQPGSVIGPYKLLQEIGHGGMGLVYMAEQSEPVERRVALKIIKPGMDTRQVIARFEAERQALAMMDHPNIAKVLDAGTTGEKAEGGRRKAEIEARGQADSSFIPHPSSFADPGRPYFVMALVKGIPITTFCDQQRLTPRERLELFIPVCHAVQHAHQKGIIHRDLKPSNVLVALYDDRPVPKVIDFGVAKAISQRLTEKTRHRHPQRHLLAGRAAVRVADGRDAL
jgi:eukaryotic-like serine/threonine-protein kinase